MKYTRRLLVLFGGRLRGWKGGVAWKDLTPFFPLLEWSNEP